MPAFEFNSALNAFTKECTICKTEYVGVRDQEESEKILHKYFHHNPAVSDGFMSNCRKCGHHAIMRRNGVEGEIDIPALHKKQNGLCPICLDPIKLFQGRGGNGAQLDHDHITGKVRGMLCPLCNRGLGKFKDSIESLKRAIEYLQTS